jgi:hypothetical protein
MRALRALSHLEQMGYLERNKAGVIAFTKMYADWILTAVG